MISLVARPRVCHHVSGLSAAVRRGQCDVAALSALWAHAEPRRVSPDATGRALAATTKAAATKVAAMTRERTMPNGSVWHRLAQFWRRWRRRDPATPTRHVSASWQNDADDDAHVRAPRRESMTVQRRRQRERLRW